MSNPLENPNKDDFDVTDCKQASKSALELSCKDLKEFSLKPYENLVGYLRKLN